MSDAVDPDDLALFRKALDGWSGDLDAWLECRDEAEVRAHIHKHVQVAVETALSAVNTSLREEALQRMADEEGALGVDYTAPDALREACEWVMSCAEEYQQRAHRAERELLALREAARMAPDALCTCGAEQRAAITALRAALEAK